MFTYVLSVALAMTPAEILYDALSPTGTTSHKNLIIVTGDPPTDAMIVCGFRCKDGYDRCKSSGKPDPGCRADYGACLRRCSEERDRKLKMRDKLKPEPNDDARRPSSAPDSPKAIKPHAVQLPWAKT